MKGGGKGDEGKARTLAEPVAHRDQWHTEREKKRRKEKSRGRVVEKQHDVGITWGRCC
jgi:hypothetical protein